MEKWTNQWRQKCCQSRTLLNHAVSKRPTRESIHGLLTPHSSSKLGKATDEAGHPDDSVGDSNAPSLNVVHRKDEGRASEGEETAAHCG